jgi:hypothetical protein
MELTAPNRLAYCIRHQYELSIRVFKPVTTSFHIEREEYMISELRNTDWLFFMGVDTCFTNFNIDILEHLAADPTPPDIVYGVCKPGTAGIPGLNNDVMLFRNCPIVFDFLTDVIRLRDTFRFDQEAMQWIFNVDAAGPKLLNCKAVPQKLLNSMPQWLYGYNPALKVNGIWDGQWEPGDFVFHAPGMSLQSRVNLIQEILKQVVY